MNIRIAPALRLTLALTVGVFALEALPAAAQAQYTIKIGSVTVRDPQHQYLDEFKKRIEKCSGGRIQVGVYPASQLGDISRMIEGVQLGTRDADIGDGLLQDAP